MVVSYPISPANLAVPVWTSFINKLRLVNGIKSIEVYLHAQASALVEIYFLWTIVYRYDILCRCKGSYSIKCICSINGNKNWFWFDLCSDRPSVWSLTWRGEGQLRVLEGMGRSRVKIGHIRVSQSPGDFMSKSKWKAL